MINTAQAVRSLRAVACIVGLALILWSLGIPTFIRDASAASLTAVSDTLSDSDRGVVANHTIRFTTPNGIMSSSSIQISFPVEFTLPGAGFNFNDLDVTDDGAEILLGATAQGSQWAVSTTTSTITITTSGANVGSSSVIAIEIGTNATSGATGDSQITNPAGAGSYEISIGGTMVDSGSTRVAIIDDVVVTANVDTTFTFTISGVGTSTTINGGATTTAGSSTATSIPFGTLAAGTTTVMAQELSVTTNAANGFVVTVEQSGNLESSTGAIIDGFINGAYTNSPTAWTAPSAIVSNAGTWGHWGLTSEDDLNSNEFGTDLWVSASTTPRQVFQHATSSDGVTANIGRTRIGFQAQVSTLQEAGDDYTTLLTYIATPTF